MSQSPAPPDSNGGSSFATNSATSRLATALRLSLAFRSAGRTDTREFLAEHAELIDLLEPMIAGAGEGDDGETDALADSAAADPLSRADTVGDYHLEREIGRGGMGIVYAAVQTSLSRRVALKLMAPGAVSERMQRRFVREAAILGRFDHEHIVRVLDAGVTERGAFLALELIDGASLAVVLDAVRRAGLSIATGATVTAALAGALPETIGAVRADGDLAGDPVAGASPFRDRSYVEVVVGLAAQVADALSYAHAHGVIHRDVKASNILVRRDGRAVLSDFGVARDESPDVVSHTNPLVGTLSSMAPEQVAGGAIDARTDVYGLGATLYEALTLTPPFAGTAVAVLLRIRADEPVAPRRLNPRLPSDLAAIVGKAMAKAPTERYASAAAFAADLRAWLAREPVAARTPSLGRRLRSFARRRPWRAIAWGSAAMALILAVAVAAGFSLRLAAETRRKNQALAEVERLGMNVALDAAIAGATAFSPARSEAIPAMTKWLEHTAQPLLEELPLMQALLADVRARAEPYTPSDAEGDRRSHPEADTLERLAFEIELAQGAGDAAALAAVRTRHADVAARVATRRTWRFAAPETQFLHDQVDALVARLQVFAGPVGLVATVRAQRAFATYARRCSLVEGAGAWSQAIAAIAADPRYGGLLLQPDEDLLPLGRDPSSGLWEFVHLRSGTQGREVPARRADGSIAPDDDMGIVLVLLPAGSFAMGAQAGDPQAPNYDPGAGPYEAPVQDVVLDAYWIGKYEVTAGQWRRLAGTEAGPPQVGDVLHGTAITWRHPVASVSFTATMATLRAHGLTLPTEAQWEYACRAGSETPWSFGTRGLASLYANVADVRVQALTSEFDADLDDGQVIAAAVGSFAGNAFGLYDMHGNVAEWCDTTMCSYADRPARAGDGQRVTFMFDEARMVRRGGSSLERLQAARSADRWSHATPDVCSVAHGARACRRVEVHR